jgi:hypothetical protein
MEDVGICILWPFSLSYGHLAYLTAIWYVCGHVVYCMVIFPLFGMLHQEKSGNPAAAGF